ncbi:MAG: hypothetical protein KDB62_05265 [Solirubrobacterales bacterium]|nr:hypothetical protein [Solirubrobacterales bacterium]
MATTAPGTTGAELAGGLRVFAAESPWNTEVAGLPVDSRSAQMLELATGRRAVREVPGREGVETFTRKVNRGLYINTDAWAPLVVEGGAEGGVTTKFVCRQSRCGSKEFKAPETLNIPPNTTPDPRYDGWLSVIDRDQGIGYDFWRARRQTDDSISYQYAKGWSLDGPGFSQPVAVDAQRAVGARGSGLPLFAGLIGSDELSGGRIDHALAISVPGLARRNFVQPASVTDGLGSPRSLPAGARVRLRSSVDFEDRLGNLKGSRRRSADAILQALRQYGAIVVDRSIVPTLYAPKGTSDELVDGNELSHLKLGDFEVVQLPAVYKDPPLSKVTQVGPTTAVTDSSTGGDQ